MANQISGKNENDVYSIGEQIRVTADPDTGYSFVQWETEDGEYIDSSNPYEQIVGEMTPPGVVNAKFKYNNLGEHFSTIKVEKPDPLLGSVTIMANDANDDPITVQDDGTYVYIELQNGLPYTLRSTVEQGSVFLGYWYQRYGSWVPASSNLDLTQSHTNKDMTYQARFSQTSNTYIVNYVESKISNCAYGFNFEDFYNLNVEWYDGNGNKQNRWIVAMGVINPNVPVPTGTQLYFTVSKRGGIHYSDQSMKILGWTMNGENINQEIPAIYGESSSSPFFETEASYDMNIGFNVVDTTYKVYVAYGEHVIHDEENTVEINDVPYNVYTGCEGSGNIVKLRPQPKTGYKIYSVSDMHSGYEYENVYEVDVYPHIDENGKYDYSSPVFIYVTAKPGDFVVYTSTYEHANGISGGTAVILENESTSYTTGYNSVVTVKATPNKQTSLYRYEFDRWVLEGKDLWGQKYYVEIEQTDSINPHNSQMQFLVTEEQTRLCACFKIYYRNNIQYEYQVPVINMGLKPSIIPQSESTTSINVKFTVNSEDITAADLRCKAGVLVSAIPHMTIERHKTILNTVNTRSMYSHNFTFDEEITNDFIKENIEIPIEFDGLKPSKVYIFRPYVFDGNYYVYGDDTYIYTDIDPLGNTETPYTLNGLFLINEPGEDLPKSLELLNQNTESIENARKALQIYPQLGELVKSTDSVSNVIGVPQFIRFTTGNLQCEIDEEHFFRFKFAEHQYDIVGSDNMDTIDNHSGILDTFGWGTSGHYFYGESGFTYDPQTGYPIETTNSTGTPIAQGRANEFDYLRCISMNTMPWSSYSGTLSELTQTDIDAYNSDIDAYNSWLEDYSGFDEDKINKLRRKYISKAAITSAWFYSLHDNLSHGYGPGEKYKNLKSMDDGYHPCQVSYNSDIARKYFDWGQNEIEGMAPGTYHMLYYPKYFRENHGKLKVRLNNVDGVMYKPDNWKEKYNDTGLFDFLSTNYVNGRIHLSPQEFRILEQYGFVFFPEAGVRYENNWIQEDGRLFYWAGNASGWDSVNFANDMFGDTKPISFDGYTYTAADRRFLGKAVRLVCDEVWTDRGKFERPTMTFDSSWFVIKNESVKYELHTYETFGINGNHEVRKYSQSDNCVEIEPDSSVICTTSDEESKSERIVCGNKYISDGQKVVFDISVTEPQYKIKIIRVSQEGDTKNPMSMHCPTNNLIYDSVNEVFYAYEDDEVMHSEVEFKTNGKNIILSVFLERKQ